MRHPLRWEVESSWNLERAGTSQSSGLAGKVAYHVTQSGPAGWGGSQKLYRSQSRYYIRNSRTVGGHTA